MNAQQAADAIYFNLVQSELEQFQHAKTAVDQLRHYLESEDLLILSAVLKDISERQSEMLERIS